VAKNTAVDPLLGTLLGHRYEVVALIARGGMASVYRAYDRQLDRVVAIKVPRREFAADQRFADQFRREARAAARLGHPNVVTVYDSGDDRDLPYIVMEHVTGRTLRDVLDEKGRLSPTATAELLAGVAAALDHAHSSGVVHLDVKPENVLLTADTVKVADFGLVRAARARPEYELAGTAQYIAPEVLRGGVVDGRADIYALGVVAYECLTGRPPFDGPDRDEVARRHLDERIPPPSRVVADLPAALDYAVLVATDPDVERRYRRASDFTAAIGARRQRWTEEAVRVTTVVPPAGEAATVAAQMASVSPAAATVASEQPTRGLQAWAASPSPASFVPGWETTPPPLRPTTGRHPKPGGIGLKLGAVAFVLALVASGLYAWEYLVPRGTTTPNLIGVTVAEARQKLADKGLRMVEGPRVADRRIAEGRVVEQSIPPGRTARRRAVIQVRLSSGLPFVAVPALAGQDEDEAGQELARLRLKVTVTRTNDERVAEGKVIRTSPAALTRLREGQTVTVVVSAGKPKVQVPDVAGQPLEQARKALTDDGFKVVDRAEPNDQVPAGAVIGTDPPTGTEVERGSQVTLVVSQGTNQVTVPNVEGMGRDQAITIIAQAGLRPVIDVEDLFKDEVKKQEPDPGTLVPRGSPVRLKLD
jgi:beta-lactam-binding protein with PASTA domain/serine/threonine protein kinase